MEKIVLDAMGKACPAPVIMTKKAIDGLPEAAVVETHVDNAIAVENLKRLASGIGAEVETEADGESHYVVRIKTGYANGAASDTLVKAPVLQFDACGPGKTVLQLSADVMGAGNDELGKALMKAFVYAASQLDPLPDAVVCYNGGVRLTIPEADTFADLKAMEEAGVRIIVCGTCANFYGLTEKVAVGTISNMYDILQTLNEAGRIIRP